MNLITKIHEAPQTQAEAIAALIKETASQYVGTPSLIEVGFQEAKDGSCYFALRGDKTDDSRLIGRQGGHIRPLTQLVDAAGKILGRKFTLRLLSADGEGTRFVPPPFALKYDPRLECELLCRWLTALGIVEARVDVLPPTSAHISLSFVFEIHIPDKNHAERITHSESGQMSLIGALGILFRAMALQHGVLFQLKLADRK